MTSDKVISPEKLGSLTRQTTEGLIRIQEQEKKGSINEEMGERTSDDESTESKGRGRGSSEAKRSKCKPSPGRGQFGRHSEPTASGKRL